MADALSRAWEGVLDDNPRLLQQIRATGYARISANLIRKYREPRLMAKHDSYEALPDVFKREHINILPISRSEYVLGDFDPFELFPEHTAAPAQTFPFGTYLTLPLNAITSEAAATNALVISGILAAFLQEETPLVATFNGRAGGGKFTYSIARKNGGRLQLQACNPQIEIDAGFETDTSIVIVEAKNVPHDDFQVRQLYFPFRRYHGQGKPVRLVFSQYTGLTYRLYEYAFEDPDTFDSIRLVKQGFYALSDTHITKDDLARALHRTRVLTSDREDAAEVPFPQADKMDRVISLCEYLAAHPDGIRTEDAALHLGVTSRQGSYYLAAARYLGLCEQQAQTYVLTRTAAQILERDYRTRQLFLAAQLFQHQIFHTLFNEMLTTDALPTQDRIIEHMTALNVCKPGKTMQRRSQTVLAWLKHLHDLYNA